MRRRSPAYATLLMLWLAVLGGGCGGKAAPPEGPRPVREGLGVAEILGGVSLAGYRRATDPRPFEFPRDHGPHPSFRTEWWYFTGNLNGPGGRAFGFQLTFFRFALAPPAAGKRGRDSRWATEQLYMAHFALTDLDQGKFYAFERLRRPVLGLAGAQAQPFRVWLDRWQLRGPEQSQDLWPLHLEARAEGVGIDLELTDLRGRVLPGDQGYSRKGPQAGNASFYYSYPRLKARGLVTTQDETFTVTGTAWFDREWGTSALGEGVVGWDWFSLQLDDDRELMLYRLRHPDGTEDPFDHGMLIAADGTTKRLEAAQLNLEVLDRWRTEDGVTYPSRWRLRIPSKKLDLLITPRLQDQELRLSVRYWEGAVTVEGTCAGEPISGQGYTELTGYAGSPGRR